jgi:uncharacterized protein (DUF2236 family)
VGSPALAGTPGLIPDPGAVPLHGRESVSWRLNQEAVLLLGGPRALLLQLAEPAVAAGVADHSGFEQDPYGRLVRTLDAMGAISFGPPEVANATVVRLAALHDRVQGTLPDGRAYRAGDPDLQWWVLATLVDTALRVEHRYLGQLSCGERERYYQESLLLADAFGIPRHVPPTDLGSFLLWMRQRTSVLEVSDTARRLAHSVLHPPMPLVSAPVSEWIALVTVDLLPAPLRAAYGLRWDANRRRLLRASQLAVRTVLPRLPALMRTMPLVPRR